MSWSIYAKGHKAGVIRKVKAATCAGDTSQFDAVKSFILSELQQIPESRSGVTVETNGHHDPSSRSVVINIRTEDFEQEA